MRNAAAEVFAGPLRYHSTSCAKGSAPSSTTAIGFSSAPLMVSPVSTRRSLSAPPSRHGPSAASTGGKTPSLISGHPSCAAGVTKRRWQASASSNPPPRHRPSTSAATGTGYRATARILPAAHRRLRQHLADQVGVEARAFRDAPAQEHEVDLAIRLLAEVEGREPRRRLGGHVERQPGAVGLAVLVPVLELLLAQALQRLARAVRERVRQAGGGPVHRLVEAGEID